MQKGCTSILSRKNGIGVLFAVFVIAALIFSGSVTAITLGITNLVDNVAGNQNVSFTARVDLHTLDVLRSDVNWTISITSADDYGGSESGNLAQDETSSYVLNQIEYEVTPTFIGTLSNVDKAKFVINGETTGNIAEGESDTILDGLEIRVDNIVVQDFQGGTRQVEFTIKKTNYSCTFSIDGDELSSCSGIVVSLDTKKLGNLTFGYGYGYGYGYDYSTGYYVTESKNFSAQDAYGYGYNSGYGYGDFNTLIDTTSELAYNITWTAPAVTSNTDYSIGFSGFVSDGTNAVRYEAKGSNIGDITVVTVTQAATDASLLAVVKDSLTYSLLTQDLTHDPQLRVISDLYMPTSLNGVDISWSTNDSTAINTTGGVTRNAADNYVQLTASLNRSAATDSKVFDFVVKAAVAAVAPDENLTVELGENNTEVFFNATTIQNISIIIVPPTIEANVTVSLNFEELINTTAVADKKVIDVSAQNLTLERQANVSGVDINYTAEIPIGTRIIAPPTWNGVINLPTVQIAANFTAPEDEGGSAATVEAVIDVGSSVELNFTQPVKITIGGQAGKRAGWSRGNASLTDIPTQCNSATDPTNINNATPRECYIDSGNDLIVWTYHFTSFAAYTPTTTTAASGTSSSPRTSGSSGGVYKPKTEEEPSSVKDIKRDIGPEEIVEPEQPEQSIPEEADEEEVVVHDFVTEPVKKETNSVLIGLIVLIVLLLIITVCIKARKLVSFEFFRAKKRKRQSKK